MTQPSLRDLTGFVLIHGIPLHAELLSVAPAALDSVWVIQQANVGATPIGNASLTAP
jgi:hypothetical protein